MQTKTKVTVLGGGAFGTCMAYVASCNDNNNVMLYARQQLIVDDININHKNSKYFGDLNRFDKIKATTNLEEAIKDSELILWALPTQVIPEFFSQHKEKFDPQIPFVSCSKGMIVKEKQFFSEYIQKIYNNKLNYCILSGPSFANEIVQRFPTLVVVASNNPDTSKYVQKTMSNNFFRIYTQGDVLGVEIAGALKNIVAIGAGLVEGFGYGFNTKTALIARGTKEIQSFIVHYGGKHEALFGLAGIGDLMLTSFGDSSRNKTFGYKLGQGIKTEQILKESKGVVEGVSTLKVVMEYAKEKNLELPIMSVIEEIIENKLSIKDASEKLLTRELEAEFAFAQF